jgi:hypothetical protein
VGLLFSALSEEDLANATDPGLDSSQIALPAGEYLVTLKTINSNAVSNPVPDGSVTISGFYTGQRTSAFTGDMYREFNFTTDIEGSNSFEVPVFQDFALEQALFSMNLDGTPYFTHLASLGWANALQSPTSSPYECEEVTLAFPTESTFGRIDIVCARRI